MYRSVLLMAASEGSHSLIDIDGTMLVQVGLFAVMALAATRWLFRPYLAMRDARDAGIVGARLEAERLSAQADALWGEYEERLAAARAMAQGEQRGVRAAALAAEREITDRARQEAVAAIAAARDKISTEAAAARSALLPQADSLARDMVARLLGRRVA